MTAQLVICYRKIADLSKDPNNPLVHSSRQIQQIARCIETFGFNCPVLIDRHDRIVAGHGRADVAASLGLDVVPTIRLEHLSSAEAKAFLLLDNRLAEHSEWDDALLGLQFADLLAQDLDFDLSITGFEIPEIDHLILMGERVPPSNAKRPRGTPEEPRASMLAYSHHQIGRGAELFAEAMKQGWEGIVSKKVDSPYRDGERNGDWVKVKARCSDEFAVVGFTDPERSRIGIGALMLATWHDGE